MYHAGIKSVFKIVINKRTRGKHTTFVEGLKRNRQILAHSSTWHFEKSRLTTIKYLVRGDKTQKSATHFRFFLYLTIGLNILTKHCRALLVICLYSRSKRICHDTDNLEQRRTLWYWHMALNWNFIYTWHKIYPYTM